MNRILSISVEDLTAVCQPGVVTGELMRAVEEKGLFYPPDPNSWEWCTLGGNVAENAGGPRALKYGVTRDYVLGLEWVLPDGEVLRVGRRTIKGVAGYDLTGLFVGSEGTLGIATEITLQLIPLPRAVKTALILFRDVGTAARAVTAVLSAGILPRTLELLDDVSVRAVDGRGFRFPPGTGAAVLAEVDGNDDEAVMAELAQLGEVCEANGAAETLLAEEGSQRERLWAARRVLSTALRALKPHKISEDIAVPRSRMPEVIERLKQMGAETGPDRGDLRPRRGRQPPREHPLRRAPRAGEGGGGHRADAPAHRRGGRHHHRRARGRARQARLPGARAGAGGASRCRSASRRCSTRAACMNPGKMFA